MRTPKASWVRALRDLTGNESDDIRFNDMLGRWEFVLAMADNVPRSQFWGWFDKPVDPLTGLHQYRPLDDAAMREALHNLTKSFVGNPHDGAGTTRKEIMKRWKASVEVKRQNYKRIGLDFADMVNDRARRLRGATFTGQGGTVANRAARISQP